MDAGCSRTIYGLIIRTGVDGGTVVPNELAGLGQSQVFFNRNSGGLSVDGDDFFRSVSETCAAR